MTVHSKMELVLNIVVCEDSNPDWLPSASHPFLLVTVKLFSGKGGGDIVECTEADSIEGEKQRLPKQRAKAPEQRTLTGSFWNHTTAPRGKFAGACGACWRTTMMYHFFGFYPRAAG